MPAWGSPVPTPAPQPSTPPTRRQADRHIVRARLDPRRAFGAAADDVRSASVELAIYDDGRFERATLEVRGSGSDTVPAAASVEYRLSRWGGPLTIEAPP